MRRSRHRMCETPGSPIPIPTSPRALTRRSPSGRRAVLTWSHRVFPPPASRPTAPVYPTLSEWQAGRAHLRQQILSAAGLLPMPPKNDLHPQIFGRIENRTYSIEKVLLETLPGYYLGGNLYRPMKAAPAGGFPGIVSPHGHWTYGRLEHSVNASIPARCINLAQQGYVVFCYDMMGYN